MDDELPGLNYLKMMCLNIPILEVVKTYNRPEKALADSVSLVYDLCFLDMEMPGINGIQLARMLGKPVIFITAYKEFAAEAFDIDAIDYLVKPINAERFQKAIEKARNYLESNISDTKSLLNTDQGKTVIDMSRIILVTVGQNDSRDKALLLDNGDSHLIKNYSFAAVKELAKGVPLIQVNKKQMIAVKKIQTYTANQVLLKGHAHGISVAISSSYRSDFVRIVQG